MTFHHETGGHGHLWTLPDGTGLHAPYGEVVSEDDTGRLCCHYCGRWFALLGNHVRTHGTTADQYRVDLGLPRRQPLSSATLSRALSVRQRTAYDASPTMREHLAVGQDRARDGTLSRLNAEKRASDPMPARSVESRRQGLARGNRTQDELRGARLAAMLTRAGHPDLPSYLRTRYAEHATLDQLARETGLGRATLRRAVDDAGIVVRAPGSVRDPGRSRVAAANAAAAARVGTDDLVGWLTARRREGWSLSHLGRAVGHTHHWVRWRLEPTIDDVTFRT